MKKKMNAILLCTIFAITAYYKIELNAKTGEKNDTFATVIEKLGKTKINIVQNTIQTAYKALQTFTMSKTQLTDYIGALNDVLVLQGDLTRYESAQQIIEIITNINNAKQIKNLHDALIDTFGPTMYKLVYNEIADNTHQHHKV